MSMPAILNFNTLYKGGMYATGQVPQDDFKGYPIREPPSGSLNAAQLEQLPEPKQSESAESAMEPEDFKTETVIPPEETRSDQKTEAQKEGEQKNRETAGDDYAGREAKRNEVSENVLVDEQGRVYWVGPEDESEFVDHQVRKGRRAVAKQIGRGVKQVGGIAYDIGAEALGDVGEGISSTISGTVTQLNTLLVILAGAYVLGQAVSGK